MKEGDVNKTKKISEVQSSDYIYMGIVFLFLVTVTILFFYSANFIIKNVNKIFLPNDNVNIQALDKPRYSLIEKKLNLPINNNENNTQASQTTTQTIAEPIKSTEVIKTPELNKKSLIINVLNAAKKAGVAGSMAKNLESAGFSAPTTGDAPKVLTETVIEIKASKKEYKSSIEEVVKKDYTNITIRDNPEDSIFDVIISVGKK